MMVRMSEEKRYEAWAILSCACEKQTNTKKYMYLFTRDRFKSSNKRKPGVKLLSTVSRL